MLATLIVSFVCWPARLRTPSGGARELGAPSTVGGIQRTVKRPPLVAAIGCFGSAGQRLAKVAHRAVRRAP